VTDQSITELLATLTIGTPNIAALVEALGPVNSAGGGFGPIPARDALRLLAGATAACECLSTRLLYLVL